MQRGRRPRGQNVTDVQPFRVETDPPLDYDGGCFMCGKPLPPLAILHVDPFCTSSCCRLYYHAPACVNPTAAMVAV